MPLLRYFRSRLYIAFAMSTFMGYKWQKREVNFNLFCRQHFCVKLGLNLAG